MWHVATMLPQGEGAQQIARKRHIGNDICILVFLDGTVLLLPLFLSPLHLPVSTSSGGGVRRPTPFSLSLYFFLITSSSVHVLPGKDASYSANTIRSHFIHNVITIRRIPSDSLEDDASQTRYHVSVASKEVRVCCTPPSSTCFVWTNLTRGLVGWLVGCAAGCSCVWAASPQACRLPEG